MTDHVEHQTSDVASQTASVGQDYLREIHHQIKNNLQIVCSLLRLESRHGRDGACKDALKRCEQRVQSMALLYDFIFRESGSLRVPFEKYLKVIIYQAIRSSGRTEDHLQVHLKLEPVVLVSKAAMSLGLIIHELAREVLQRLPNHDGEFKLVVSMRRDGPGLVLDIEDDFGPTESAEAVSLSSQIVGALVQQFRGELVRVDNSVRLVVPSLGL